MIVDVDTHWEASAFAEGEHPLEPWLAEPAASARRPRARRRRRPAAGRARRRRGPTAARAPPRASCAWRRSGRSRGAAPPARLVVGGTGRVDGPHRHRPLPRQPGRLLADAGVPRRRPPGRVERCNDFLTERLADHADRLHAVAVARPHRPGSRGRRARARPRRGARARSSSTPCRAGRRAATSPGHPIWDACGTAASTSAWSRSIHVGNTASDFTAGPTSAGTCPAAPASAGSMRLANTQRIHAAQNLLSRCSTAGSSPGTPTSRSLLAEMRVDWIPPFLDTLSRQSESSPDARRLAVGRLRRRHAAPQRAGTPLPGFGDADALDVLARAARECRVVVGLPAPRGQRRPDRAVRRRARRLDADLRAPFLGGNIGSASPARATRCRHDDPFTPMRSCIG